MASIVLAMVVAALLITACSTTATGPPSTSTQTPRPTFTSTIALTETPDPAGSATPGNVPSQIKAVEDIAGAIASRTPAPAGTPDAIEREIEKIVSQSGLTGQGFLGLSLDGWINILASILAFVIVYVLVVWLLFRLLEWLVGRTKTEFDDAFLNTIERELRWLVVILAGRSAVLRLDFWGSTQQLIIEDVFFFLALAVLVIIALRLIRFGGDWVLKNRIPEDGRERLAPLVLMSMRLGYLIAIAIAASVTMAHLGVSITWLAGFILLLGVIAALGARESIADLANGILILLDPPYRQGDDIFISEIDTWGRVVEVSLRNTHLRTLDNRYVIVPNERIGKSQIINYGYPDPSLRIHTDIGVAYGTDFALMRQVIVETVSGVEGVVLQKPVKVFFMEFGQAARLVRVTWWIENVNARIMMMDRVNTALEIALNDAGIIMPYPTYNLNLKMVGETGSTVLPGNQEV